jgi:hypothetical protein
MASNDLTSQGDFNAKISDAVDDLFNAVRQIEIDPATNEVKELGPPTSKAAKKAPALELEKKGGGAPAPAPVAAAAPQSHPILAKLDQSLMTLDWEVSRSNAGNMRDLLDKAAREYDLGPLVGEGGVISLMHQILAVMSDAPESVPTSGPLALKSSLSALRVAALEGQPYSSETRKKLEQAQNALLSVLPEQRSVQAAAQQAPAAPRAAAALPRDFQVCLKNHIARLDLLLTKRLIPVENFFSKTASLAKLHVLLKAVRQQLAEQSDQLKAALAGRYTNVMPVADPVAITIKLGNECQMLMQYHLQVLNHCARRIAPIEKLFADMEGQQKLHAIHFEIRSGLMTQLHYLAAALDGDFGPLPPLPKLAAAPPRPAVVQHPQSAASDPQPVVASPAEAACPWPTLMVARWRGEHVAFIPEQVCLEGQGGFGAGNISRQPSLRLNKLKSWPWSSLKSRCKNALAEKTAKELASLEFPILDLPVAAAGLDGKHVVVLFQEAKGGVVLVDSALEDLEVGDQYQWQPVAPGGADIVSGTICSDFGDPIPVVDIRRL